MGAYIIRRILLIIPTMFGIMVINFLVVQFAPGGPVEQIIAQLQGTDVGATSRITGGGSDFQGVAGSAEQGGGGGSDTTSAYRGAQGLDPEFIKQLGEAVRLRQAAARALRPDDVELFRFDFGKSYFRDVSVIDLILEKMPVSISLGLWTTLIVLLHLDPARHPQGGAGRLALRHLDERASSSSATPSRASCSPSC